MATDEDDTFFLDFGDNEGVTTGGFSPVPLAHDSSRMKGGSLIDLNEEAASNPPDLLLPSHVFLTGILPDNNPPNTTSPSAEKVPSNSPSFPEIRLADDDSNTVGNSSTSLSKWFIDIISIECSTLLSRHATIYLAFLFYVR
jgi:hypothetical protein